ncbi:unnamed protein product [Cuscuta campestris]|uniref:Uncharacterized protein n=1 Tax=Cuscuta campestris TaxID=132261 RepID=A0A484M4S6_9ASTE|nr:unnamed protein product [Cuscuta campestris]
MLFLLVAYQLLTSWEWLFGMALIHVTTAGILGAKTRVHQSAIEVILEILMHSVLMICHIYAMPFSLKSVYVQGLCQGLHICVLPILRLGILRVKMRVHQSASNPGSF